MATNLTLANRYAHSLAQSLMVAVIVFRSEAGFSVVTADEFEGDPASVVTESTHTRGDPLPPGAKPGSPLTHRGLSLGSGSPTSPMTK